MIQLKLKLNSNKPSTVYSLNGKSYRLVPGTNVLNLEYDDYISLAKALSITPVEKPAKDHKEDKIEDNKTSPKLENEPAPVEKSPMCEHTQSADYSNVNNNAEDNEVSTGDCEDLDTIDKHAQSDPIENEDLKESLNESFDYSSWSYTKLKSEYKRVTGNACKLKKDEVIAFLQENTNNVE
jgi:hypothetical protein